MKKRVVLIGIASSSHDIHLGIFALTAYARQFKDINRKYEIIPLQYARLMPGTLRQGCANILGDILEHKPDIVGFSCFAWNMEAVLTLIPMVKEHFPQAVVIMGGPEIDGKKAFANVDQLIIGEGEIPFVQFLRGEPVDQKVITPLDDMPSAYTTQTIPDSLFYREGMTAILESQRGCNFHCAYCQYHVNSSTIRYRDIGAVVQDVEYIYHHTQAEIFRFADGNFLSSKERVKQLMRALIDKDIKMGMICELIPSFVDEEIAALFKEYIDLSPSNKITVGMGLQSVNPDALAAIRRKIPLAHFERAYDLLNWAGVILETDLIIGLPRETYCSWMDALEFMIGERMRGSKNHIVISQLMILPGSDMADILEGEGLKVLPDDPRHFVYETPTMSRADMVKCFRAICVVYRIFNVLDNPEAQRVRDYYYEVKDKALLDHRTMLTRLADLLMDVLKGTDFANPDFPNAERFWYFQMPQYLTNDKMIELIGKVNK